MKTASCGVDRVDAAMVPILAQIEGLKAELAALDVDPGSAGPAATADAVTEWQQAVSSGDTAAQRTIIKRLFPKLTLRYPQGRGDYSARRIALDGLWHALDEIDEKARARIAGVRAAARRRVWKKITNDDSSGRPSHPVNDQG